MHQQQQSYLFLAYFYSFIIKPSSLYCSMQTNRFSFFTPFRWVVLFAALALLSVFAIAKLSVQFLPEQSGSLLTVSYTLAGSSPQVAEQQVTSLLENGLSGITGIIQQSSESRYHGGALQLQFAKGTSMQEKQFEVAAILRRLYPQLPEGCSYPQITISAPGVKKKPQPLLVYTLNAPLSGLALQKISESTILPTIQEIPGVEQVAVSGVPSLEIRVQYQMDKCRAWGIDPGQIAPAIQEAFATSYPGSTISATREQLFLRLAPSATTLSQIEALPIATITGSSIPLGQLATIQLQEEKPDSWFRINGKNAVTLQVFAKQQANTLLVAAAVKNKLQALTRNLPTGYELRLDYDDAAFLQKELQKNYIRTGLSVGILLLFMLLAYRHWKHLLVLICSLLVTLALTILLAAAFQIPIHLYSLAGIAISFGLLIDNAIVMLDYYRQYQNKKVFLALLAATLTTMAALLLVFLLPEEDRQNLGDFAAIIAVALSTSLLVSLYFTPALYQLLWQYKPSVPTTPNTKQEFIASKAGQWYYRMLAKLFKFRTVYLSLVLLAFGLPLFLLPTSVEGDSFWAKAYNNTLGGTVYQQTIRPVTDKYLGGALYLFRYGVFEKSSYRSPEQTRLYVNAKLPYGHTPAQMNALMETLESFLKPVGGIEKFVTHVYGGQDAAVEIQFTASGENSGLPFRLKTQLIARCINLGGADWDVYGVGKGFSNAGGVDIPNFRVKMTGYSYDQLERLANILGEKLLVHPRIQTVNTNEKLNWSERESQEYVLNLNEEALALQGIQSGNLFREISFRSQPQGASGQLTMGRKKYPLYVEASRADDYSVFQMNADPLYPDSNQSVKIATLGKLSLQKTANSIVRENRSFVRLVGYDYLGSPEFGSRHLKKVLVEMNTMLPPGYTAKTDSYTWDWNKTKRQYGLLFLLAIAIYCICSILFGKLKQPLAIVWMIPLSFIGLFLSFAWGDFYFDQGGYAAFVLLAGLVVNAAIFITNDYNGLLANYPEADANTLLASAHIHRARTILLTVVSTCCSLIPFLMQGQDEVFWFAFAVGTLGGLLCSMLAVFFVLPVLLWKKTNS